MTDTLRTLADTARELRTTGHWSMNEVSAYLERVIAYADHYQAAVGTYERLSEVRDANFEDAAGESWWSPEDVA